MKKIKQIKQTKRYFFSVVEEVVMNPDYQWGRGGRIEVYDNKCKDGYAIYEARWFLPIEFADKFREVFDFKESDRLPYINWNQKEDK